MQTLEMLEQAQSTEMIHCRSLWNAVLCQALADADYRLPRKEPTTKSAKQTLDQKLYQRKLAREYLTRPSVGLLRVCRMAGADAGEVLRNCRKRFCTAEGKG